MRNHLRYAAAAMCAVSIILFSATAFGEAYDVLLDDIDRIVEMGDSAPSLLISSFIGRIEDDPRGAASLILPLIRDRHTGEKKLGVCLWALGFARDHRAVGDIVNVVRDAKSEKLKWKAYAALAAIGSPACGKFLMGELAEIDDPEKRFKIINLLAEMQYEPALPLTDEILKKDPAAHSRECYYVFGKYGDRSVPFLISKIDDADRNVRLNAIVMLASWLNAPESVGPLRDRYGKEPDVSVRGLILNGLERTTPDIDSIGQFSETVLKSEADQKLAQYAKETLSNLAALRHDVDLIANTKKPDRKVFDEEYMKLFKSFGKTGDYTALSRASESKDEPKLKQLREKILRRNADDSFGDYEKVTNIIVLNRLWSGRKTGGR